MTDNLDCSWIENEEKMVAIDKNYIREPIHEITLFFIYVNCNMEIELVSKEIEIVHNGTINKERLLQIIQNKRIHNNNKKYRLDDILSFQIDLEPENIQSFSDLHHLDEISATFLKSVPIFDEIVCIPSIFIFHDISSLYFLFNEIDVSCKSILRNGSDKRVTKKVRIMDDVVHNNNNNNKSMKKFMKKMKHTRKALSLYSIYSSI